VQGGIGFTAALGIEDPVIQSASAKAKGSGFPNADQRQDSSRLLVGIVSQIEISDSNEPEYNKKQIEKLLTEQPGSDEDTAVLKDAL
jgi:hypothetical protein